jgi:hypothetical protein
MDATDAVFQLEPVKQDVEDIFRQTLTCCAPIASLFLADLLGHRSAAGLIHPVDSLRSAGRREDVSWLAGDILHEPSFSLVASHVARIHSAKLRAQADETAGNGRRVKARCQVTTATAAR